MSFFWARMYTCLDFRTDQTFFTRQQMKFTAILTGFLNLGWELPIHAVLEHISELISEISHIGFSLSFLVKRTESCPVAQTLREANQMTLKDNICSFKLHFFFQSLMTEVYQGTRHSAHQILGIDNGKVYIFVINITGSINSLHGIRNIFCECL